MKFVYAERARRDIEDIFDRLASKSARSAQRVEDMIRATCEGLSKFPFAGAMTSEVNVRRVPLVRYPYTIFYRVDSERKLVEIARVVHSARVKNLRRIPKAN